MLSAEQCQQFESQGYVLAQPLSPAELTDAQETWHRLVQNEVGYAERADDAGYIRLISHPFFEGVAKQLLRSSSVHLAEMSVKELAPGERTGHGWESGCHLDWQITTADWNATPRRDLLAIWLWVEDVTPEMGAMRILPSVSLSPSLHVSLSLARLQQTPSLLLPVLLPPLTDGLFLSGSGSHLPINEHWERVLIPEQKQQLPRQHGLSPKPSESYPSYPEHIPETEAAFPYSECEPMPVAVPAGTAQIFTQSMLHASWENSSSATRKGFVICWCDATVPLGWDTASQRDRLLAALPGLRASVAKLRPGREHIVSTPEQFRHRVSLYEPRWGNTFLPGKTAADAPPSRL